jgi:hypothetical protein
VFDPFNLFAWTAQQREAYANYLDAPHHLVAVTARSNRSKADKDPAQWLPPHEPARCRYIAEWTAVKQRWQNCRGGPGLGHMPGSPLQRGRGWTTSPRLITLTHPVEVSSCTSAVS